MTSFKPIEYNKSDGMSLLRLGYKMTLLSVLLTLSCSLICLLWWKPAAMMWLFCGEAYIANNWGSFWPTASEEMRPSVPQPVMSWILPTPQEEAWKQILQWLGLPMRLESWPIPWLQPSESPWAQGARQTTSKFLTLRNCKVRDGCCFKLSWGEKTGMQ